MSLFAAFKTANVRSLDNLNAELTHGLAPFLKGKGLVDPSNVSQLLKETNLVGSSLHKNLSDSFIVFKASALKSGFSEKEITRQFMSGIAGELPEAIRAGDPILQTSITRTLKGLLDEPFKEAPRVTNINAYDFMADLLRAKGKNNKTAEDFAVVQKALEEAGQLHRGTAESLGRKDISTLSEIARAVQRGEKITSDEFSRLKAGNPKQGVLTAEAPPTSQLAAAWNRVIGMVTNAPKSATNLFGVPYNWDGVRSGQLWTRLGTTTAIVSGTLFAGYQYANGDARGLSTGPQVLINNALKPLDWISTTELEVISGNKNTTPLMDQTFITLTSGNGLLNPRFVEYTKDLTGINIADSKYRQMSLKSLDTINLYIDIATTLQSTEGRTLASTQNKKGELEALGYNAQTLYAYKYAFAANLGLRGVEKLESYDQIVQQLRGRYEQAVFNALTNPNKLSEVEEQNRNIIKKFLGTSTLPEGKDLVRSLLERFADDKKAGGLGEESLIRPAIAKFLIKNGNVKGDEKLGTITIADAQNALKEFTVIAGEREKAAQGTQAAGIAQRNLEAGAARNSELAAEALRNERAEEVRRGTGGPVSQMRENGQGITRKVEPAVFESNLSELTDSNSPYSAFKGQSDKLRAIFNSSRNPDSFDQEVKRSFPSATQNAVIAAREFAYQRQ